MHIWTLLAQSTKQSENSEVQTLKKHNSNSLPGIIVAIVRIIDAENLLAK